MKTEAQGCEKNDNEVDGSRNRPPLLQKRVFALIWAVGLRLAICAEVLTIETTCKAPELQK